MNFFKIDPKESNYVGGKKHFRESIENVGLGGDMISLHPDQDFNTGSILTVHPGEQAIFEKNGQIQQVFEEGRYKLSTENYPFISRLRNAFTGGVSTFNCRVYFLRTATSIENTWGTGEIQVRDKELHLPSKVYARGAYRVKVDNGGTFLFKLIGNNITSFGPEEIQNYFKNELQGIIKSELATVLNNLDSEILGIQSQQRKLAEKIRPMVAEVLEEYGVGLDSFSISNVELDMDDDIRHMYEMVIAKGRSDQMVKNLQGEDYRLIQSVEIAKTQASNPRGGNMGAEFAIGAATYEYLKNDIRTVHQPTPPTPPPSTEIMFKVYSNGEYGPYSLNMMKGFVSQGRIKPDTWVWKEGMPNWAAANTVPELMPLFAPQTPPPPMSPSSIPPIL